MGNNFSLNEHLKGKFISQLRIDHAFSLLVEDGSLIIIENAFSLAKNNILNLIDPENMVQVAAALPILHLEIEDIQVIDGKLHIKFLGEGTKLSVSPHTEYEAWQISLANNSLYICMPDGEVALFTK